MKTDEQLLAEAYALDAAYMSAEIHDLRGDVAYLTRTLHDLYHQVEADIPEGQMSQSLLRVMYRAAEALGLGEAG